jgi:hypothetical protein
MGRRPGLLPSGDAEFPLGKVSKNSGVQTKIVSEHLFANVQRGSRVFAGMR